MKQVYLGAASLLLGTSAIAWAQSDKSPSFAKDPLAKEMVSKAAETMKAGDWAKANKASIKLEPAAESWFDSDAKLGKEALKAEMASETWFDGGAKPGKGALKADMASESWLDGDATAKPKAETVAWTDEGTSFAKKDTGDDLALASKDDAVTAESGVGGPYEPVDSAAASASDMTPHLATRNYPPCSHSGPGDDNCIQLYEPGVRQQLASWTQPVGGLAGTNEVQTASADISTETGVGGPYEPVDTSMNTASLGDAGLNGGAADEVLAAKDVGAYTGMGGPLEEPAPVASSGSYPACSHPGPGEDRCIQLYERGVSGS